MDVLAHITATPTLFSGYYFSEWKSRARGVV